MKKNKKSKKFKLGKLKINFNIQKKTLFLLAIVFLILASFVGVYAFANSATGVGHNYNELQGCANNQILKWTTAGGWSCVSDEVGVWNEGTGEAYYNNGNVGIGTDSPGDNKLYVNGKTFLSGGLRVGSGTAVCDVSTAGMLRYVTEGGYTYFRICMQISRDVYDWVNIVTIAA